MGQVNYVLLIALGCSSLLMAQEGGSSVNRARLMWSAFECGTFAELAEDQEEQQRLFLVGIEAGRSFLRDVQDETIQQSEYREAPIGVLMLLGGPSIDFIIGRVFESAMGEAYDSVVKDDASGVEMDDPGQWRRGESKAQRGRLLYDQSNCELVRFES